MKSLFGGYLAGLVAMIVVDGVWLALMGSRFYRVHMGHLMAQSPKLSAGALLYVLYVFGLFVLVVLPLIREGAGASRVFLSAALFGLVAYGAYDLTNHATLRDWPLVVTLVDMLWGAVLTGAVAVAAFSAARWLATP